MPNTKQNGLTTEEPAALYDVSSDSVYLPVYNKAAALDTIFKDTNVKHGLTMCGNPSPSHDRAAGAFSHPHTPIGVGEPCGFPPLLTKGTIWASHVPHG